MYAFIVLLIFEKLLLPLQKLILCRLGNYSSSFQNFCVFQCDSSFNWLICRCAFLAHLSRRLIGELIVYPWSVVHPSVVRRPQCSNIFSETAWPIKAKFYVEPPWVGGRKFCSRHLGHMTKMAATPIYSKNPSKIFFSRTGGPIFAKLVM